MANLRLIDISVSDSTHLSCKFTHSLSPLIDVGNISISSETSGVDDPLVMEADVIGDTLSIRVQPLVALAAYIILFSSTEQVIFKSINGDAVILNDATSNKSFFLGPVELDNPVKTAISTILANNVYQLESGSKLSTYIDALSSAFSKALYSVGQTKNNNYLSFNVVDEFKIRGDGPFDRLDQEGAYEIVRVGLNTTNTSKIGTITSDSFPPYPFSLLSTYNSENISTSNIDTNGSLNLKTLTISCIYSPVIVVSSIVFIYNSILAPFTYDISELGYQLKDSRYDPENAFTYLLLEDNQIRLSDLVLQNPLFSLYNIASIQISYQFKNNGLIIDPASVSSVSVLSSGRESLPPIENIFSLKHGPIVSNANVLGTIGSVVFSDPNNIPGSNTSHPAFLYEITFRLEQLPSRIGEYAVNYSNGAVYVYGSDDTQSGTGAYPPIATYLYRHTYQENIDYIYDDTASDLVALPNGSLIGSSAIIGYQYEQALIKDIDYSGNPHQEALSERIDNRILALNAIRPLNFPITNVFRIYNETSGEIYKISRWTNDKIFFTYQTPPAISENRSERASFDDVLNETLFVSSIIPVSGIHQIFKIDLMNDNIIANSEDGIGYPGNSSVYFSETNLFTTQYYYDGSQAETNNLSILSNNGDYQIDYTNGIVWIFVSTSQEISIGTISYKRGYIKTQSPHITSIEDLYYKVNAFGTKTRSFDYHSFDDTLILPSAFDRADEQILPGTILPYQIVSGAIGVFENATFVGGVGDPVKYVRGIFERQDFLQNPTPTNFSSSATVSGRGVSVSSITFQEYHNVLHDGSGYYITVNSSLLYLSSNITRTISVVRLSDSAQLWNGSGTIQLGNPFSLRLPGVNSPSTGDSCLITYSFQINDASRVVVDYSRGDYLVDYSYLADEIIISYEYGENVLNFAKSVSVEPGDQYYVSYKVGALRDALLGNFGSLIDIPILNNLNVDFDRERYRDALIGAMQSFTSGPTVASLKNIVEHITHAPPEIIESAFQNWDLSTSLLSPELVATNEVPQLLPGKYGTGALISKPSEALSFPVVSNLRIEEGTMEMWVIPQWNGIDNQSDLTLNITRNNFFIANTSIFLGPGENHPTIINGYFTVNDADGSLLGIPPKNKDGIYLYLAPDASGLFDRWYLDIVDGYADGYVANQLSISVKTNGAMYDVKKSSASTSNIGTIASGVNSFVYKLKNSGIINEGITFAADYEHYLFDFGNTANGNRFSIFRDASGYLNYRVIDKVGNIFTVDSDVSLWKAGEQHHVAVSWALNTLIQSDEMHLFIDGQEVSNILQYGGGVSSRLHQKFRTISTEEIIGLIPKNIVGSTDLVATSGLYTVSSSLNFTDLGIAAGDTLYIEETGFYSGGYAISNVNGNTLTLSTIVPITAINCKFSINKTNLPVSTATNLYKNIAVSTIHSVISASDLVSISTSPTVSSASQNFTTLGVSVGYLVSIGGGGFEPYYTVVGVSGHNLTLSDNMPTSGSSLSFKVYSNAETELHGQRALNPSYSISNDGYFGHTITITNEVLEDDIILLRTLGLNHGRVRNKYYLWGNSSNILNTRLPSPIELDDVEIFHTLLDTTAIGPGNSTLSGGIFTSNHLTTDQPSVSDNGRTMAITVGGDNIDHSIPITVVIHGTINGTPSSTETITFAQSGIQNTVGKISLVSYIVVACKPADSTRSSATVKIRELYPITETENSITFPIIRFSYQMVVGNELFGAGGGNLVEDDTLSFSSENIGNYLIIYTPSPVAGTYQITDVSDSLNQITLDRNLATSFAGGNYEVLNTTTARTGLQNGLFTFEQAMFPGLPYTLNQGIYELDYHAGLSIPLAAHTLKGFVGSDFLNQNSVNAIIDDFRISDIQLSDTRIGETVASGQDSITKHYNSVKSVPVNINSLMVLDFESSSFKNKASYYLTSSKGFIQSGNSVNANFNRSIIFTNNPLLVDNAGILNTKTEGSIEFWVNPIFDTGNDPNYRFYFDATGIVTEELVSINNATIKVAGKISSIQSVKLKNGSQKLDYFPGGIIEDDRQTIILNNRLPNQQANVIVSYIPNGLVGDRIAIYKDLSGYLNFTITSANIDHQVRAPIFWTKNTWHRVRAQYKINQGLGTDEMRLFIDGYEQGNVLFGNGLLFGQHQVFGSSYVGHNSLKTAIPFKDTINEFTIGSDYTNTLGAYALIDNLRISNVSRSILLAFGESIDPGYSANTSLVFPSTEDLYTTLLLDFNRAVSKTTDFAILRNRNTGLFDITINVPDSFGILESNSKAKTVMETLISALKPANSRVFINYE